MERRKVVPASVAPVTMPERGRSAHDPSALRGWCESCLGIVGPIVCRAGTESTSRSFETSERVTATKRDAYIDNARAILIGLVVFGHLIETRVWAFKPTYLLIYAFHMPAFALVSGYLSKPDLHTAKGVRSLARLVIAYVVFQAIYTAWAVSTGEKFVLHDVLVYPYWLMWWIMSLIMWRIGLQLFAFARARTWSATLAMVASIAIAVACGYVLQDGKLFSLSRTLVFFPFFLAGYLWRQRGLRVEVTTRMRIAAAAVFVVAMVLLARGTLGLTDQWLWARMTYAELGAHSWQAGARRLMQLGLSAALVASLFALVPRTRMSWITTIGAVTLPIYLWHGLLVKGIGQVGWADRLAAHHGAATVTALGIIVLLSWKPVSTFTTKLIAPWTLFARPSRRQAGQTEPAHELPET